MKFSKALEELEAGKKIRRSSWFPSFYVKIIVDDILNRDAVQHIALFNERPFLDYWKGSDEEILADDWEVVLPEVVCDIVVRCPRCKTEMHLYDDEIYELLNCPCGFQYKPVKPKRNG